MRLLIKPVLKGIVATFIALFFFWQVSILVIFMIGISSKITLFVAVVFAQLMGGYASTNNLQGQSRLTYLIIGGISGIIPIICVALILVNSAAETGFDFWVVPVVLVVGIVSSIAGSHIGSMSNFADIKNNS